MKMAALLTRNAGPKPGVTGTARVDRDIDRLLRRVGPGDIVILDALDLDRITADALVEAEVAAVVNASSSISRIGTCVSLKRYGRPASRWVNVNGPTTTCSTA